MPWRDVWKQHQNRILVYSNSRSAKRGQDDCKMRNDLWADDKYSLEIRKLRNVDPTKAYDVCTRQFGKPLLINKVEDIDIFYLLGGHALVKAEVCEKYMPEFSQNYIVKSHA